MCLSGGRFEKPFQISVSIEAVTEDKKPIMLLLSDGAHNKTRKLSCFGVVSILEIILFIKIKNSNM